MLQFHRAKVNLSHVAWPAALLFFLALVLLSVFTAVAPLEFQRVVIDESTGESIGRCDSDMYDAFLWPIGRSTLCHSFVEVLSDLNSATLIY